jgi:hypothetical protein
MMAEILDGGGEPDAQENGGHHFERYGHCP